jgi:sec-independent protein translocase protein TatC
LTITEHLEELRSRIIKSIIAAAAGSFVSYGLIDSIMPRLARPAGQLVFIAPQEAFVTNIKIALFGGVFLASPVILYQIWRFISTGLKENEAKYVFLFAPLSFVFFLLGAAFGYLVIVPIGLKFLLGFATETVRPMISVGRYVTFVGLLTIMFGVIFELPIASLFLTKLGVVTPYLLANKRKYAIVSIFLVAAALTPPDVVTQCLMAVPLLVLYELGIIFSKLAFRREHIVK